MQQPIYASLTVLLLDLVLTCSSVNIISYIPASGILPSTDQNVTIAAKANTLPNHYQLRKHLLENYEPEMRPVLRGQNVVTVTVRAYLYQIAEIDQVHSNVKIALGFYMKWDDHLMTWDPADFGGLRQVYLPATSVWNPNVAVWYGVDQDAQVPDAWQDVRIRHPGHMSYFSTLTARVLCPFDVKYFPFDVQTCEIVFSSWIHLSDTLEFIAEPEVMLDQFFDNQEWLLESAEFVNTKLFTDSPNNTEYFSQLVLIIRIRRQPFFYIFILVVPALLITFACILGLHLPGVGSSVETNFMFGMTTTLSMTVLVFALSADMPRFALVSVPGKRGSFSSVPLLETYYVVLLVLTLLNTITSSLLSLWADHRKDEELEKWIKRQKAASTSGDVLQKNDKGANTAVPAANDKSFEWESSTIAAQLAMCNIKLRAINSDLAVLRHVWIGEQRSRRVPKRLNVVSFVIYMAFLVCSTLLFFYHDWY